VPGAEMVTTIFSDAETDSPVVPGRRSAILNYAVRCDASMLALRARMIRGTRAGRVPTTVRPCAVSRDEPSRRNAVQLGLAVAQDADATVVRQLRVRHESLE
jgi:hypothetical protein